VGLEQWIDLAQRGGAIICPFLLGAIMWLNQDRKRLIEENKLKDERLVSLSERSLTVFAEVRAWMLLSQKAS